ncbi:MAG: histidinol-phosphate aminotransferase family protein [Candidatus Lokiarchaeota archaeon]|nr:histidinol-phosphate aminotransferase family protein [Candidatus Lokiarchaeota archaeon]
MNIDNLINKDKSIPTHEHHGGEIYKLNSTSQILDFSTNINSFFPYHLIRHSYIDSIHEISKYPDTYSTDLRRELVNYFNNKIDLKNLIVGAGSMDLISIFCDTFVNLNDEIIICQPTFSEYSWAVRKKKGKIINVYRKPYNDFAINSDAIINKITSSTKVIFICNPNNPNGSIDNPHELKKIVKIASENDVLIFLDEAFIDFTGESNSFVSYINTFNNLVILRTFTKFFGIPGLRIGYAISSYNIIDLLNQFQNLWSVNSVAQNVAKSILKMKDYISRTINFFSEEIKFLSFQLSQIPGLKIYPTNCNFFLINLRKTGLTASKLQTSLLKDNILIRNCTNFDGLNEYYVRINIKTRDLNLKLLNSIRKIIN